MKTIILVSLIAASCFAAPQQPQIGIKRQELDIRPDGTHNYVFETENGIYADQQGYAKDAETQAVQGQYQYVSPEGQVILLTYQADENGFQPKGDHLPTPPPTPPEILKSLELNARSEANAARKSQF